jgi:hypothetical protein
MQTKQDIKLAFHVVDLKKELLHAGALSYEILYNYLISICLRTTFASSRLAISILNTPSV